MQHRRSNTGKPTGPAPTVGAARTLLAKARAELPHDRRQASEKGWLAMVTAGRAMLRAAGMPWASAQKVADRVQALEEERHMPDYVSVAIREAAFGLHGHTFYIDGEDYSVENGFKLVERAIDDVAEFVRLRARRRSA